MGVAPFSQLEVFLAVARHRSFSAAGRELGVSRSAVSHTVRLLEQQLRVVLLARTTRSVSLTDAGKLLVASTGPLLGQVAAALSGISARPGETVGRLRLSVPPMAVPFVLEPVLPAFALGIRASKSKWLSKSGSWTSWQKATTLACASAKLSSAI